MHENEGFIRTEAKNIKRWMNSRPEVISAIERDFEDLRSGSSLFYPNLSIYCCLYVAGTHM